MTNPFIISAKFTMDGSSVTASAGDIRAEFTRLGTVLDTSARKAVVLQTALDARQGAAGAVTAYQSTLQLIRAEQQLESQRLSAQTTEIGRAQSINRLAQLARDAAAASQSLARAEGEAAQAAQLVSQSASSAATAVGRLADQQQRVAALRASGINSALGVRDEFGTASRGEDIAAYGRALDEMRAQYNPLFAAQQRHVANLAGIARAQQLGAISSREAATAIRAEGAAYSQAVAQINGNTEALQRNAAMRGAGTGGSNFATANIAAQFQDIAVTSAMGMSPLQIALQQGTQISAVFGNMGAAGAVKTLASAFLSVISPVSLVTIGLVAGTAAAIQYFSGLGNGAQDADERLDEHLERIEQIARGYDDAIEAAENYIEKSRRPPEASVAINLGADRSAALKEVDSALSAIAAKNAEIAVDFMSWQSNKMIHAELIETMGDLGDLGITANSTEAEIGALHSRLTALARDESAPRQARQYASDLLALMDQLDLARIEVDSLGASLNALPSNISTTISVQMEGFNEARTTLMDLMPDFRTSFDRARDEAQEALNAMRKNAPDDVLRRAAEADFAAVMAGIARQEAETEAKRTARTTKEISAYERQIQTIQQRTAAQQLETNVIGLGTFATERARMQLELENAAREDAIGLSPTRIAQIQEEATAYALAAAAQEKAVEAQRLAVEQVDFARTTFRSFFSDLKAGLKDGQDGWAALGNAGANALDRIADRALGMAADGIFDMIFSAITGAIGGGMGGGGQWGVQGGFNGFKGIFGVPGFDEGGWTGGVAGQARGLVHGEEFVVRAGPAAQHRSLLESINAGGSPAAAGNTYAPISNFYMPNGATRAEFEQMLDERDRRIYANMPGVVSDAARRAVGGN